MQLMQFLDTEQWSLCTSIHYVWVPLVAVEDNKLHAKLKMDGSAVMQFSQCGTTLPLYIRPPCHHVTPMHLYAVHPQFIVFCRVLILTDLWGLGLPRFTLNIKVLHAMSPWYNEHCMQRPSDWSAVDVVRHHALKCQSSGTRCMQSSVWASCHWTRETSIPPDCTTPPCLVPPLSVHKSHYWL